MALVNEKLLRDNLIRDEGIRSSPYFDTKGFVTFGVGRNLEANPLSYLEKQYGLEHGLTSNSFIFHLFNNDLKKTLTNLYRSLPWIKNHPEPIQRALANMAFQLGVHGLLRFKKTLPLIEAGKYFDAGEEMKDSKWYRKDSPQRATRVIKLVQRG